MGNLLFKQNNNTQKEQPNSIDTQKQTVKQQSQPSQVEQINITISILLTGYMGAGKTSLQKAYVYGKFDQSTNCQVGPDFRPKQVSYQNQELIAQIWDVCGMDFEKTFSQLLLRFMDGIALCYDITNRNSFDRLSHWLDELNSKNKLDRKFSIILIGCKSDLENNRMISYEEGKNFAKQHGFEFFETSSKQNINIDLAFQSIIKDILKDNNIC